MALSSCGGGVADPWKYAPPHMVTYQIWSFELVKRCERNGDPSVKLTPRIPLFKVTQGHWNRHGSIGYI